MVVVRDGHMAGRSLRYVTWIDQLPSASATRPSSQNLAAAAVGVLAAGSAMALPGARLNARQELTAAEVREP
jgi:hypothetical protein